MSIITLDQLIEQGKVLKQFIHYKDGDGFGIGCYVWHSDDVQSEYSVWKNTCKRFLFDNYQGDISNNDFEKAIIDFQNSYSPRKLQEIIGVLEGYKTLPRVIKTSIKESNENSVNVHVNNNNSNYQQQNQGQQFTFDLFISAIDDELTGKQRKELKAYLEDTKELPDTERKQGIVDKLTSFGKDLSLNILANILTNPQIWGGL